MVSEIKTEENKCLFHFHVLKVQKSTIIYNTAFELLEGVAQLIVGGGSANCWSGWPSYFSNPIYM